MEFDMEASPSYFDPEDPSTRAQYRRYRKRLPSPFRAASTFEQASILFDGNIIQRLPNAPLILEGIKQEVESVDADGPGGASHVAADASRKRANGRVSNVGSDSGLASPFMKSIKLEGDVVQDGGDSIFSLFASLFDSALHGLMSFSDLILHFESTCQNISESIRLWEAYQKANLFRR